MGRTALMRAAFCRGDGGTITARALLEHGADPDARDAAGDYPCLIAAKAGNHETLEALLDAGANVYGGLSLLESDEQADEQAFESDEPPAVVQGQEEEEARSLLRAAAAAEDRTGRAVTVLLRHFTAAAALAPVNDDVDGVGDGDVDDDGDGDGVDAKPPLTTSLLLSLPPWLFSSGGARDEADGGSRTARYRSRDDVDGGDEGTALHVAATCGNLEAVEMLLRAEAAASAAAAAATGQRANTRAEVSSSSSLSSLPFRAALDAHGRTAADVAADDACRIAAAGLPWTPSEHPRYPLAFRAAVRTFLLCLNRRGNSNPATAAAATASTTAASASATAASSSSPSPPSLPSLPQGVLHEVLDFAATPLLPWRDASSTAEAERRRLGGGGGGGGGEGVGSPLDAVLAGGGLDMDALAASFPR
jgi:hypothetical protein